MHWNKYFNLDSGIRCLKRFRRQRSGGLMVTYALITPFLLGTVGLGIESANWYAAKRTIQTKSDAAARAGAYERRRGNPSWSVVSAAALREAQRNGYMDTTPNSIIVNNPPSSGPNAGDQASVEVIVSERQDLFFSSLFLNDLSVKARSVATVTAEGTACVLALDPSASGAISNLGNPAINMDGCILAANSNDSSAISISGSATLDADSLWTAGEVDIGGSATVTLDVEPSINTWPLEDPYVATNIPAIGPCDHTNIKYANQTLTINPGVYCGGIDFGTNAIITLNPGTYYVDEGDIKINATAVIRCLCLAPQDGVTFILMSSSGAANAIGTMTINGGADVILRAPTGTIDPFAGILVYQDRQAPQSKSLKFNGGSTMLLTGALYAPNQTIEWSGGNSSAGSTCTQIIGKQVKFVGNSEIVNTGCIAAGIKPVEIVGVKITE